ncbi:MAG: hypothetical protein O2983_11020 [Planctomycetota bacterium]|nr:hypothetical protein [Planctomycetota bacterium]MDA0920787.1 hypothetical protein [Planctomycetota bacterium]MDA1160132.1 hypothetical protein [Planctomycetota bacterium]
MRHTIAITAGLILSVQGFAVAQNLSADDVKILQAARSEIDSLKSEIQTLKESCGIKSVDCSATISRTNQQMILRRYRWVPASSVAGLQTSASGLTTSGVTTFQNSTFVPQSQLTFGPSSFAGVQTSPLLTNNFATPGFSTGTLNTFSYGTIGDPSFAPTASNILPASPYAAHQSYDAYSNGPVTQSMSAGFSAAPVYPTATFRGTSGFVNSVPAPYYSAY